MTKVKTAFDAKGNSRTKEDVDQYNKMVAESNASLNAYNAMNNRENAKRTKLLDDYNNKVSAFTNKFVPKDK